MHKKLVLFFLIKVIFHNHLTYSQSSLTEFAGRQQEINRRGMISLGIWATGNMLTGGGYLLTGNPTGEAVFFHRMNIYWNTINLTLAGANLLSLRYSSTSNSTLARILKNQKKTEGLFLLNTGLDVGYIVGGLYLRERAKNNTDNSDLLRGFGNSIILQGSYLFAFDLVMAIIHIRHSKKLDPLLNSISIGPGQAMIRFHF